MHEIKLTEKEIEIFDLLKEVNQKLNLGLTLRVAGGWPRDKLLGIETDDIDIAVDNMSGLQFATKVAEHLGAEKVGVVQSNPDASKHLETAILEVCGVKLDFVGFRKEEYDPITRNPIVSQGDIFTDGFRRDLTINAMYWNLQTNIIEDITGEGLKDLHSKYVRLVVPPVKLWNVFGIKNFHEANIHSFTNDPLRVLRSIRTACKYGFILSEELIAAAKDPQIVSAFRIKIRRERMEIELRKIMTEANPARGIKLLKDFGLLYDVFKFPEGYLAWDMDQNTPHHKLTVFDHTMEALNNLQEIMLKQPNLIKDDKLVMNYAILLHDTGKLNPQCHGKKVVNGEARTTYYGHEEHSFVASEYILRNLPGVSVREIERVKLLIDGSRRVNSNYTPSNEPCRLSRKALGKFVRLMKEDWVKAVLVQIADATGKDNGLMKTLDMTYYSSMMTNINQIGPKSFIDMKPLLDGNEITTISGLKGKDLGHTIKRLVDWQLEHPNETKEMAEKYIKTFRRK